MLTRSREKASGAAEEDERSAIFMETGGKQCFQSINKTLRLLASPRSLVVIHRTSFVCETLDRTGRRHVFPFSTHSYRPVEVNKEIELHGCVFQTVIFNCVWRSELFIMCPPQSCREGSSPALRPPTSVPETTCERERVEPTQKSDSLTVCVFVASIKYFLVALRRDSSGQISIPIILFSNCFTLLSQKSCANVLKCLNTSTLFLWIIKGFCRKRHQNYVSF